MARASISIGVDDATGQPATAPEGPYITDRHDGSERRQRRGTRQPSRHRPAAERPHDDTEKDRKGPAKP